MERDELVRLAGEQALLQQERQAASATFARDKNLLLGLYNEVNTGIGRNPNWLEDGIALLRRLHENQATLRDMDARLAALRKLTGL